MVSLKHHPTNLLTENTTIVIIINPYTILIQVYHLQHKLQYCVESENK